ncbi:HAD domain-containing protein [Glycomyces salinus]|uniref:HAD domain-containing protein n=1 Tax=Glycomyces salinus TaxID=980294 RepID=UPI0018ECA51F|nr:HAD domain-containing protein [Glycomyces salinus]
MIDHGEQQLLFLDVDGTLIPFGQRKPRVPEDAINNSYVARLNPQLGPRLAVLPCQLVWASTWEDEANTEVAPRLDLPSLPVVYWPEPSTEGELEDQWFNLHWKTRALVEWAAGRSFAWVDDEITEADIEWAAANYHGRAFLLPVDASQGLTDNDLEVLGSWLRGT